MHSHRLHDKHSGHGEEGRFFQDFGVVGGCGALLGREGVVTAQMRDVVLIALDGIDGFLWRRTWLSVTATA